MPASSDDGNSSNCSKQQQHRLGYLLQLICQLGSRILAHRDSIHCLKQLAKSFCARHIPRVYTDDSRLSFTLWICVVHPPAAAVALMCIQKKDKLNVLERSRNLVTLKLLLLWPVPLVLSKASCLLKWLLSHSPNICHDVMCWQSESYHLQKVCMLCLVMPGALHKQLRLAACKACRKSQQGCMLKEINVAC